MQLGQREKGTAYPVCRFDKCQSPFPRLSVIESVALELFIRCQTQWDFVSGFGGVIRVGIPYDRVERVANAMEIPLTDPIFRKFQRCEQYMCKLDAQDKRRQNDNQRRDRKK